MMYLDHAAIFHANVNESDNVCSGAMTNIPSGIPVKILKRNQVKALCEANYQGQTLYAWVYLDYLNRHNKG